VFHPNRGLRGKYFNDWGAPQGGRGTYNGDKPPVQAFTERRGETRFFVKRNLSRDDTNETLNSL